MLLAFAVVVGVPASLASTFNPVLVKDVATAGTSDPHGLVAAGGVVFFGANDGTGSTGTELWKSDGTDAGTTMVKDVNPGPGSGIPGSLEAPWNVAVGSTIYFRGNDGTNGWELWKSDGTAGGTTMVKDINPGAGDSFPVNLTVVGSTVFFLADDGTHGAELWKSDGTTLGTTMVKDINPGAPSSNAFGPYAVMGGTLYFAADDGSLGTELWKSDGTTTQMVKNICPGSCGTVENVAVSGGTLFFSADDGTHGQELWKLGRHGPRHRDGQGLRPRGDRCLARVPHRRERHALLRRDHGRGRLELWKSDGTDLGTAMVKDIKPGVNGSIISQTFVNVGGTLFFRADDGTHGYELWKSDGTDAGTTMVKDINSFTADSTPTQLTSFGGNLFFSADDGTHGFEPWTSDGTSAGTTMVMNIAAGSNSSTPANFTALGGATLFFTADDVTHGKEVWKIATAVAAPTVSSFTPTSGGAGTSVTITGSNFTGSTAVTFHGTAAQSFTIDSDTQITAVVAAGTTSGPVAVTNSLGTGTSAGTFSFIAAPTISSFNAFGRRRARDGDRRPAPTSTAPHVALHGVERTRSTVLSATTLTFTVPAGATTGAITVVTAGGTATSGSFSVTAQPPTITSISPGSGPVGTLVTITGTNLDGTVGVMIGSIVTVPTSASPTSVTFAVPPGAPTGRTSRSSRPAAPPRAPTPSPSRAEPPGLAGFRLIV